MTDKFKPSNSCDEKREDAERIEQLSNIADNYTRTERHLEQYSDISRPENLEHAKQIQEARKEEMNNLKSIIAYNKHEKQDGEKNLRRNYEYTENYLKDYSDVMDKKTLESTKQKQQHRKDQIDSLTK